MKKQDYKHPKFIKSATRPSEWPKQLPEPEIAICGRSNVGKSSLLNHLFQRKGLVKTSSIPGKTQLINFFTANDQFTIVDLPGYGFAQVPVEVRKKWGPMIQSYLEQRASLKLILFLFDIRRMPNAEDFALLEWFHYYAIPYIIILTKVDKVSNNEKKAKADKIMQAFGVEKQNVCYYSTLKNIGRLELIGKIQEVFEN